MHQPWVANMRLFKEWVLESLGERPTPEHSLDRINNDGNYEPGNLRWATKSEQTLNSRRVKVKTRIKYGGKIISQSECAAILGVSRQYISLIKLGKANNKYNLKFVK